MRSTKAILNTKTTRRAQPLWLALVTQTFWSRSSASRINKTDYILYLPPLAKKFANGLHSAFDSGVIFLVFYLVVQKGQDRKSTRLNYSHVAISYVVFFLNKKIRYFAV